MLLKTPEKTALLSSFNIDFEYAVRDGECLIKGTVPANCIK